MPNKLIKIFNDAGAVIRYNNKTQRSAGENIIKALKDKERAYRRAEYACKIQGRQYAPQITTPAQLEKKMGELVAYQKKTDESFDFKEEDYYLIFKIGEPLKIKFEEFKEFWKRSINGKQFVVIDEIIIYFSSVNDCIGETEFQRRFPEKVANIPEFQYVDLKRESVDAGAAILKAMGDHPFVRSLIDHADQSKDVDKSK